MLRVRWPKRVDHYNPQVSADREKAKNKAQEPSCDKIECVEATATQDSSGNWWYWGGMVVNAVGLATAYVEYGKAYGDQWRGKNGKWNSKSWGGNGATGGRTAVLAAANGLKALGQGFFLAGSAISIVQGVTAWTNGDSFGVFNSAVDIGWGAGATFGGWVGWAGGVGYFGTSALLQIPVVYDYAVTRPVDWMCSATGEC